jgi:peptidoglycan/LPS O-acetylase OafA/YrhL
MTKPSLRITRTSVNFSILDALRGFAALYVCIAHSRGVMWIGFKEYLKTNPYINWGVYDYFLASIMSLTKLSGEFVIFFFVLSGFSIAHSLCTTNNYLSFIKKRFIRLYPTYLIGLIWASLILLLAFKFRPIYFSGSISNNLIMYRFEQSENFFSPTQIVKTLLYNPNIKSIIAPYWSLVYEVIFYLLAPVLILKLRIYGILSLLVYLIGLKYRYENDGVLFNYLFHYNFYFLIGIYTYFLIPKLKKLANKISLMSMKIISVSIFLLLIFLESVLQDHKINLLLAALFSVFLISNFLQKNVRIKWLEKIGEFSYTLYATHFQTILLVFLCCDIFGFVNISRLTSPFLWLFVIPICLIIAYLIYSVSESPIKNYLTSLRNRSN